jgi:hypothetical protein
MRAASIWVQGPLEGHAFHAVECGSTRHLLVSGLVGAALCFVETLDTPLANDVGEHARRGRWLEVKEQLCFGHKRLSFVFCSPAILARSSAGYQRGPEPPVET